MATEPLRLRAVTVDDLRYGATLYRHGAAHVLLGWGLRPRGGTQVHTLCPSIRPGCLHFAPIERYRASA